MSCSRTGITFVFLLTVGPASSLTGQQLRLIEVGVHAPGQTHDDASSDLSLTAKSVGWSIWGSLLGGITGLVVDQTYCERHHGKEAGGFFGPCFLYANEGFGTGWFSGAIIGSTYGAVKEARKRGCPRGAATLRALAGATVGAAPGVIITAQRTGKYPASRAVFIAGAPLLSGLGAAAAVGRCRGIGPGVIQ
jgi:hypothetical protein